MIELDRLSLDLGPAGIHDISLNIPQESWTFIIGPSGAGKTLILEAIAGLHHVKEGRILIRGSDVSGVAPEKRGIALVYQDYSLFPHQTVAENIAFGLRQGHTTLAEQDQIVSDLLGHFRLTLLRDRYPGTLSGGEQQRVAVARALINNPSVILADEPSGNLDTENKNELHKLFFKLRDSFGQTIIIVTHDRQLAGMSDRILQIKDGLIINGS